MTTGLKWTPCSGTGSTSSTAPTMPRRRSTGSPRAYGRGTCPTCGRDVAVSTDGTVRPHAVTGDLRDAEAS